MIDERYVKLCGGVLYSKIFSLFVGKIPKELILVSHVSGLPERMK